MSEEPYATCEHCDKSFTGPEPYLEHLASKAHDKKKTENTKHFMFNDSNIENKLKCEVCNVFLSGEEPMKQHLKGNKHISKLKKINFMETIESQPEVLNTSENVLACKVCEKCFSGSENLKQHLKSKKHIRKVEVASFKQQMNGGVEPSCPPPPMDQLPKTNIYPSLTEDYKIVHNAIENNEISKPAKKTTGCFSAVKQLFKSKKD